MERLELLPVRVETSYVSISQMNLGFQLSAHTLGEVMSQSNAAFVWAPSVEFD